MNIKKKIINTLIILLAVVMTAMPTYAAKSAKIRTVNPKSGNNKVGQLFRAGKQNCRHEFSSKTKRYPQKGTIFKNAEQCVSYETKTCRKCNREKITKVNLHNHVLYVKKSNKNPIKETCTTKGYTAYFCRICKHEVEVRITQPLGHKIVVVKEHKYKNGKNVQLAYFRCKNCKKFFQRMNGKYYVVRSKDRASIYRSSK